MQNIQLYIQNNEIELDNKISFALTKQFEDLNNPTDIINDWSKTVSIPGTAKNNKIFGQIFRIDRKTVNGDGVGIYFDPTKKIDMMLKYNEGLLLKGYAKVNSVMNSNGFIKYNLTLYGQLGKIFQEMKLISFNDDVDQKYYINTDRYFTGVLDRNIIYNSWNRTRSSILDLDQAMQYGDMYDFIGFTPNLAKVDGFDYASYQGNASSAKKFTETLENSSEFKKAGMSADTALPNGVSPRELGEFRSYHQLPYIYVNKLFQIFKEKAEELTGYEWDLDDYWFNNKNPYWNELVYLLEPITGDSGYSYINKYTMKFGNITGGTYKNVFEWYRTTNVLSSGEYSIYPTLTTTMQGFYQPDMSKSVEVIDMYNETTKEFTLPMGYTFAMLPELQLLIHHGTEHLSSKGNIGYRYGLEIKFMFDTETFTTLVVGEDSIVPTTSYENVIVIPTFTTESRDHVFDVPLTLPVIETSTEKNVSFKVSTKWICVNGAASNISPVRSHKSATDNGELCTDGIQITLDVKSTSTALAAIQDSQRSYTKFNIAKFWNADYSLFDEILRYCKVFGILIITDDENKKLKFIHRSRYFKDYTIEDWTDKVDFTKDFAVVPIINDHKYMVFNYNDIETNCNQIYKGSYGTNFGELKLNTNFNFDNESVDIMPKSNPSITHTPNILSWNNLYSGNITYTVPKEYYVDCKGDEDKYVSCFGSYFFVGKTTVSFDTNEKLNLRQVRITDDTPYMITNNTYMYNQTNDYCIKSDKYQVLKIENNNYEQTWFEKNPLSTYNVPSMVFDYKRPFDPDAKSIYDIFWKNWLNERHGADNKIVTCYVNIQPLDYLSFRFNKFIKIKNQLYFVNKIYDYDITGNLLTKVDLLQITDISAYNTIPYYVYDKLTIGFKYGYIDYKSGMVRDNMTSFESISPVTFLDGTTSKIDDRLGIKLDIINNKLRVTTLTAYSGGESAIEDYVFTNDSGSTVTFNIERYSVYPEFTVNVSPKLIAIKGTHTLQFSMRAGITDEYREEIADHPTVTVRYDSTNLGTLSFNNDWQTWQGEYYPHGPEGSSVTTQEWSCSYNYTINANSVNKIIFTFTTKEGFVYSVDVGVLIWLVGKDRVDSFVTFDDGTEIKQVELPEVVKRDDLIIGLYDDDGNVVTSKTLSNGSLLSVVDNRLVLSYGSELGTVVSTTSFDRIYLMHNIGIGSDGDIAGAPPRLPEEWDELESIISNHLPL